MKSFFLLLMLVLSMFPLSAYSQTNFDFYISNAGSDTNSGNSMHLPRQTLSGSQSTLKAYASQNGNVSVGVASGSIFNEAIKIAYPISLSTYFDTSGKTNFAVLNGSDVFDTGWQQPAALKNTWKQKIKYNVSPGSTIGNNDFLVVLEIDKELEKTAPFTARKVLQWVSSLQSVEATRGSFYEPVSTENPVTIAIHTSDGSSPNNNSKFRYEVTVRNRAIDAYSNDNSKFENLWVRGYGAGYGLIPGGNNSSYSKIIFGPGTGRHHLVTKNAFFKNCLFLPTAINVGAFAVVFYDAQGLNRTNSISNTIFLDVLSPIYAHVSNGTNYNNLSLENIYASADSNRATNFVSASSTDTITLNNISTYGYYSSYSLGSAEFLTIKNSYFHYAGDGISFGSDKVKAIVNNVFINGKNGSRCIKMDLRTDLQLTNSILQVTAPASGGIFIHRTGLITNHIVAKGNIFIANINTTAGGGIANTDNGIGTSKDKWDSNVYIIVKGKILWGVTNRSTNGGSPSIQSFSEWQRQSGQDKNSLFFDLRKDPRGLKAIFIDPDNGNYELANTVEGNKIRALKAGMTTPLHCFLKKPTYEEAAEMIRTEKVMKVDDCRNPCQQAKVRVIPFAQPGQDGMVTICQGQELAFEGIGVYTENNTYYHQSDAKTRYLWWFSDGKDTSGSYLHRVTHRFTDGQPTDVRLQLVDPNGCDFDTTITVRVLPQPVNPDLGNDTSLCTGQTLLLKAGKSAAGDRYIWSTGDTAKTTLLITKEGEYWLRAENSNGCTITDTINVINKTPVSVSLGKDTLYCASSPNLLTPATTGAVKTYQWSTGATTDTFRIPGPGTYILTAKDSGVCLARDTIVVADNPVNTFSLPGDTLICEGTSYSLTLHPPAATFVKWNDGVQGYSHIIKGGTYSITSENNGCLRNDSMLVNIQPLPVVRLRPDTLICSGYALPLSASYTGARYQWSTGGRDSSIVVTAKGTYWVQANINGCNFRDSINVAVQNCECEIEIPNAFSPNGDGINDVLRPKMKCFPLNYNLSVFNRYGQVVFNTRNYSIAWDGTSNGKPLPVGTYYYVLTFDNEGFPNPRPFTGSITLLR